MTDTASKVLRVRLFAQTESLTKARQVFGCAVDDWSITEQLDDALARADWGEQVALPAQVALALWLWKGGRAANPPALKGRKRKNDLAVRVALELRAQGMTAEKAAEKAKAQIKCRISARTIYSRITHPTTR